MTRVQLGDEGQGEEVGRNTGMYRIGGFRFASPQDDFEENVGVNQIHDAYRHSEALC